MLCGDLNGKEIQNEGVYIYIYMYNIHFAAQQKLTQHCKATILQLKIYIYHSKAHSKSDILELKIFSQSISNFTAG